jgi:hypothetical protein
MSASQIGVMHSRRQTREAACSTATAVFEKFAQVDLTAVNGQVELGFLRAIESAH